VAGDRILIDGQPATSYTFSQNYYWMMGDNRHRSQDSRFWGYVPHDHVVGKAVLVWFTKDPETGIRWKRLFTLVD
jgi:signal peptidase I